MENLSWQLGNGEDIEFWTDKWVSRPIVEIINAPANIHNLLGSQPYAYRLQMKIYGKEIAL